MGVASLPQALKDRVNDLKAFVDVLTVYCNDPRELTEVRTSEAALKEQVASLQTQLEVSPRRVGDEYEIVSSWMHVCISPLPAL